LTTLRTTLEQALAYHKTGDLIRAEALYRQVLRQSPGDSDALNLLGVLANQTGHTESALEMIGEALAKKPTEGTYHGNYAVALQSAGRVAEAIEHYREAVRLKPTAVAYLAHLSEALQQQGDIEEALTVALEALRINPLSAQAYCMLGDLAEHGTYVFSETDVQRMHTLLDGRGLSVEDACLLNFTLGSHYERANDQDQAFACYRQGNDCKLQVYRKDNKAFDREKHHALIDNLITAFRAEFMVGRQNFGIESEVPIFVVGLVRAGTTLVEQILASHPGIYGAGERKEIDQQTATLHEQIPTTAHYPLCVEQMDQGLARSLAYSYLLKFARAAGSCSRIVDKMPHNYLHLGYIAQLFPRARIVHCRRDPMDVCFSAYTQNFKWMPHASSLEDIAFHHRQYVRLMDHWQRVLPLPIHEVVYEQMVADPEGESRKLIAACGMEWDERCSRFYDTRRSVQTASKLQVRQPIYRHSVGRWKKFASHLEPLRLALGR
jgi:tetratricopeptide (TPR) repeat protein